MAPRVTIAFVTAGVVGVLAAARVQTQPSSGSQDTLDALLDEVHALRTTIEVVISAGAGGQLSLGRLQLQEQRLNAVIQRLESTQESLAGAQREALRQQEQCTRLEMALKDATLATELRHYRDTVPDRADIEEMLKMYRRELATTTADIQRLTAEEATLMNTVAVEQSRWSDLNRQIEEIELTLARSRQQPGPFRRR